MKEPAGEANMTVITIVLIGVVAAVGLILVPRLMRRVKSRSCCNQIGGYIVPCPEASRRGKICCTWRSDQTDHEGFNSEFDRCMAD